MCRHSSGQGHADRHPEKGHHPPDWSPGHAREAHLRNQGAHAGHDQDDQQQGKVILTIVPGTRKGQKEQYELLFAANATLKASHSSIISITVN